jgi:hypothetical protein
MEVNWMFFPEARRFSRFLRRLLTVGCLTLGVVGVEAAVANAATPPSLAPGALDATSGLLNGTCTSDGNGSFTFSVSGTSEGNYPGTYTASGSFTITSGTVTAFSDTFTISSSTGSVTGTYSLATGGSAQCDPITEVGFGGGTTLDYTATINGAYQDTGTGRVEAFGFPGVSLDAFNTGFGTSNGVVSIAGTQAAQLVSDATGRAPGTALLSQATAIQKAVNTGRTATACADIANFLVLVNSQTGKKLNSTQAGTLRTDAQNLSATLGC